MTDWIPQLEPGASPLYVALADAIARDVVAGVLQPGRRLPTHRVLADALGINVTTVTRGYGEAERRGLVSGAVGRGTFIAVDATTPASMVSFEPQTPGLLELGLVSSLTQSDPDLGEALKKLSRRKDPAALMDYSDPRGLPQHREAGAALARQYGLPPELATAEDIMVTAGAQHGVLCCLMGLFRTGERIATDAVTYPGLKGMAAMLGLRLCPIAMDEEGMLPEALDLACRRGDVRGLYVLPEMHNPTTVRLSEARRRSLAGIARRYGLTIIEDDAYALTMPERGAPLTAFYPEGSCMIAGLSKVMGAGLRVGFLRCPPAHRHALASSILHSIWMVPSLNAEIVAGWIHAGVLEATLAAKRVAVRARQQVAQSILEGESIRWREAGYYGWWQLPNGVDSREVEADALRAGVNVFAAAKFAVGDAPPPQCLRISLTGTATEEALAKGLNRIKAIVQSKRSASQTAAY